MTLQDPVLRHGNSRGFKLSEKPEIPSLTGLRGIAAVLVVIAHYHNWVAPWNTATIPRAFWLFSTADYGMTLFFTLSGFVITYNYFNLDWDNQPLGSFGWFMYRRISRLYPVLIVFLLWAGCTNHLFSVVPDSPRIWTFLHVLSIETWVPAQAGGSLPMNSVYNVSWSISTEIGMYLMFAVAMVLKGRLRTGPLLALAGIFLILLLLVARRIASGNEMPDGLAVLQPMSAHTWYIWFFYQSPYFRILDFAAGAAAAYATVRFGPRGPMRYAAIGSVCVLVVFYYLHQSWEPPLNLRLFDPWYEPAIAILFAIIMFASSDQKSMICRILSMRPLITLGGISYSLYLFHPFIPRMGMFHINQDVPFSASLLPAYAFNFAMLSTFAIAFAFGTYHLLEAPSQRALRKLWRRSSPQITRGLPATAESVSKPALICPTGDAFDCGDRVAPGADRGLSLLRK